MRISYELMQYLKNQGFNIEKKQEINNVLAYLKSNDLPVFDKLLEYLEIFDGHQLKFPVKYLEKYEKNPIDIVTLDCIKINEIEKGREKLYENTTDEKLVMIGSNSFHYIFMMSLSGKIYAGFDMVLYFLGNDIEEALMNLYEGPKLKQIELKVDPCLFENKIYHIHFNELEEYKNKFKEAFCIEIDGKKCKKWKDYIHQLEKKYSVDHYYKDVKHHSFYIIEWDHKFDFTNGKRNSYLLIIKDYNDFLSKELDIKAIFEDLYKEEILHYFDNLIVKCSCSGEYKPFNILLVDNLMK